MSHRAPEGVHTLEGIDCSNNNGHIDWVAVASCGKRFAFIKATEGTFFRDGDFPANFGGASDVQMWRYAYHFARPGRGPSGADEAHYFCDWVLEQPQLQGDGYVLDLEEGPPGADLGAYVLDWCQTVQGDTGVAPIIYSTPYMLQHWQVNRPEMAPYRLWIAAPNMPWPQPIAPWTDVPFHQYSWHGRVPGIHGDCDLDRFQGSEEDLFAYGVP